MSFVLCHDCYTWVEPEDNRCPHCLLVMDLSVADPPLQILREAIGEVVERLGEIRTPRRLLPEWGILYATTQGLFFVPHEMDQVRSTMPDALTGQKVMWTLGTLFWSPLLFLMPFVRREQSAETSVQVLRPRYLSENEPVDLPAILMDNPGAFFLPRKQIRTIYRKRSSWTIERSLGSRIQFLPVDSPRLFHERFSSLLCESPWQSVGR